ncbi:hypothetical protein ES708_34220 [subsurface metagenome]
MRARSDDSKRSVPSSCRLRSRVVLVTDLAFLDTHKVITIIIPAIKRNVVGVCTASFSASIEKVAGSALPLAMKALKDSKPASGTPIKLTRSFPANAIANANVPTSTINFKTLILNSQNTS